MTTIELTIRLRVPDDTTPDQLANINGEIATAAAHIAGAQLCDNVELVEPLQDVIVYGAKT